MGGLKTLIILQLVYFGTCMDQLNVLFEWKELDYEFPTPEARQQAIDSKVFIPENNIPMGIEIYGDKLFMTVTRWRSGVPSSLNYINLKDTTSKSPILKPYPSWSSHSGTNNITLETCPEIVSPYRIRIDRCDRLWVADNGKVARLEPIEIICPRSLLVYDLKTNQLLRKHVFPDDQVDEISLIANVIVEDQDCEDSYAYVADSGRSSSGIIVYSWMQDKSWKFYHDYFKYDPDADDFEVAGIVFNWRDAIFGLGLTAPDNEGISTLYFHPMTSYNEYSLTTNQLKDENNVNGVLDVKFVGTRGVHYQSAASFLDQTSSVLFFVLINQNSLACWNTNKEYIDDNRAVIFAHDDTITFASDIKIDGDRNILTLWNNLQVLMQSNFNTNLLNIRIYKAPLDEMIQNTVCK